jgi:RimJ/RimL family protein N-acetyltransferase
MMNPETTRPLPERSNFESLSDGTIALLPLGPGFEESVYEAVIESIPELVPFMPWCHEGYLIEEARAFLANLPAAWEDGTIYAFGVLDAVSGRSLGVISLNRIDRMNLLGNIGYWVRTGATGKGVATRATVLCARFGIEELGLNRIEILASVENVASIRVAEKSGAVREGVLRGRLILHGRAHDAVVFSILRGDPAVAGSYE